MNRQVLIPPKAVRADREHRRSVKGVWKVASAAGLVFALASAFDLALGLAFVSWSGAVARFTALTSAAAALPMLAVGIVLLSAAALIEGSRGRLIVLAALSGLLALVLLGGLLAASTAYGETLAAAGEVARLTVRNAMIRAWVFGGSFGVTFAVTAVVLSRNSVAQTQHSDAE